MNPDEMPTEVLAETENFNIWVSQEPDGEVMYHLEIGSGNVTIHFFQEEWDEFMNLLRALPSDKTGPAQNSKK